MTIEPLDPIPLSALQHWAYCPRQCTLIHVEQGFEENLFTSAARPCTSGWMTPVSSCATACASSAPCRCFVTGSGWSARRMSSNSCRMARRIRSNTNTVRATSGRILRLATISSWRRRRCVWKRCSASRCRKALCITPLRVGGGGGGRCRFAGENRAGCGRGSAPARGQHFAAALERRPLPRLLLARSLPAGSPGADAGTCGRPAFPVRSG